VKSEGSRRTSRPVTTFNSDFDSPLVECPHPILGFDKPECLRTSAEIEAEPVRAVRYQPSILILTLRPEGKIRIVTISDKFDARSSAELTQTKVMNHKKHEKHERTESIVFFVSFVPFVVNEKETEMTETIHRPKGRFALSASWTNSTRSQTAYRARWNCGKSSTSTIAICS
jgi:hypothetical protein